MSDALVSIIIPLYNEEKYVSKCVESLIKQTYPKSQMEWIFVDGNSTDKTVNHPHCAQNNAAR